MCGVSDEFWDKVVQQVLPVDGEVELMGAVFADFLKRVERALMSVVMRQLTHLCHIDILRPHALSHRIQRFRPSARILIRQ